VFELVFACVWPTERQLKSEAVNDIELPPESDLFNYKHTLEVPYLSFCS